MNIIKTYVTMKEIEELIQRKLPLSCEGYSVIFRDVEKNYDDFSVEFICEVVKKDKSISLFFGNERTSLNLEDLKGE